MARSDQQRRREEFARQLATRETTMREEAVITEGAHAAGRFGVWCPVCLENTDPHARTGQCMFCDTQLIDPASNEAPKPEPELATVHSLETSSPGQGAVVGRHQRTPAPTPTPPLAMREPLPRRRERAHNRGRAFTDEQMIARAQLWARIIGTPPSKADWNPSKLQERAAGARDRVERDLIRIALYQLGDFPSETTVRARFGSMNALLVQAGFAPRATGRQPKDGNQPTELRPKTGPVALNRYHAEVLEVLDSDDMSTLKARLYTLALSAIQWADRIPTDT